MTTSFRTLYRREVTRSWRVRAQTFVAPLVSATLYLLIFGVSIGANLNLTPGESYLSFLVPGLIMMAALNNSLDGAASAIVTGKYYGDLQDLRVAPLSYHNIVWGIGLSSATRGASIAIGVGIIGELFSLLFYREWIQIAYLPVALLFLFIAALSLGLLGVAIGFRARTFDQMSAFLSFILLPLIYLGGVFFPLSSLPHFWQVVSRFNPILYYISGLRYGILGRADVGLILCICVSLAGLLLAMVCAYLSVRRGRNYQL